MQIQIDESGVGRLTTDHAASSHGLPVLVVSGEAYGPADRLPAGWRALRGGEAVGLWAALPGRTPEERRAARSYCAQWPEGPQVPPEPAQGLAALGRGSAKRRPPEHYREIGRRGGQAGKGGRKPRKAAQAKR